MPFHYTLEEAQAITRQLRDSTDVGELYGHPRLVIFAPDLLERIPEPDRVYLVREGVLTPGSIGNNTWVEAVLDAGIDEGDVADMIVEKLRRTEVDPESSVVDFLRHDFLELGSGRVDRAHPLADTLRDLVGYEETNRVAHQMLATSQTEHVGVSIMMHLPLSEDDPENWRFKDKVTLWSVLSHDQLMEALEICIEKAPSWFFRAPDFNKKLSLAGKLRLRLLAEELDDLLLRAAGNLRSLAGVSVDALARLAPHAQLELLERLGGGSPAFLIRMALTLGESRGLDLFDRFSGVLDSYQPIDLYRRFWSTLREADSRCAKKIEQRLRRRAIDAGYALREVKESSYYNRRWGREVREWKVTYAGMTYVQYREQRHYRAREGDWVFFEPDSGLQLTPHIRAVQFIPAHSDGAYH